jgi:hypothetical protein
MYQRAIQLFVLAALCIGIAGIGGFLTGAVPAPTPPPEEATVIISGPDTETSVVNAEVSATRVERYRGLSDHDSLATGEGMLFVHGREREYTYVMREMDFGIDIIFINDSNRVTTVHSAPAPGPGEDGSKQRYSGTGRFVLEVPRGYAAERGIEPGSRVTIECPARRRADCFDS